MLYFSDRWRNAAGFEREEGRPLRFRPQRKVQTAQSRVPGASRGRATGG